MKWSIDEIFGNVTRGGDDTSLSPNTLLSGAINPDIIIGLINGEVVSDIPTTIIDVNGLRKIRFIADRQIIEIRYSEEIYSAARRAHLKESLRQSIAWAAEEARRGKRKFITPRRKKTVQNLGGTRKSKTPAITIEELRRRINGKSR